MAGQWLLLPRVVGGVIIIGVLLPAIGALVASFQGNLTGLQAAFRGVESVGDTARGLATVMVFAIPGTILQLIGFALFTLVLRDGGDRAISAVAFGLLFAGLVLATVEGSFQASVTVWAGEQHARSGAVPEFFEPLRQWLNIWLQRVYVPMTLVGVAGYGWAILETGLLPRWVGWGNHRMERDLSVATGDTGRDCARRRLCTAPRARVGASGQMLTSAGGKPAIRLAVALLGAPAFH